MNWGLVKEYKRGIAFSSGLGVLVAGFGIETFLCLESSFMGLPEQPAIFLAVLTVMPFAYSLNGDQKYCLISSAMLATTVAVLYFAADYVELLLMMIQPSWKMIVPILHDLHFYWGFYFVGTALTVFGTFMPQPKEAEAG